MRLLVAGVLLGSAIEAGACQVLVVGSDSQCVSGNGSRVTDAASFLTSRGYTVTAMAALPGSLAGFDVVWDARCTVPMLAADMTQLAAFLAGGFGVFTQSEYPGVDGGRNASLQTFVDNYLCGGTFTIGTSIVSPGGSPTQLVNAGAPTVLSTVPNNLVGLPITVAGAFGITAYGTGMQLLSLDSAGVWDCGTLCGGQGKLVIVGDSNWLDLGGGYDTPESRDFADNIAAYLCTGCAAPATPTATATRTSTRTPTALPAGPSRTNTPTCALPIASVTPPYLLVSPNAFNPSAGDLTVTWALANRDTAQINVFNSAGEFVRRLALESCGAGQVYRAIWDGRNDRGEAAVSGVYILRLVALGERRAVVRRVGLAR